ncbi:MULTISPECIES: response regulator transcription factor [unclassified Brevibacterium]|uniref:response regulator n=1 Tax=unclassified Brevibacterium TaxID=2614124 RepID=UPI0008A2E82A|nr:MULTISPECIES: response regulator transcription factor [unclassified Brevibacterium]OFL64459.1 DNA-binding response regulator [Brevibacterium sp. HMSC063G07]OFS27274.1 DNA-binding response regulator [Brevibacterium sp. HMSC07C04]
MVIRVLLVDDHPVVRAGLASVISSADDIDVVDVAESGSDALNRLRAFDVDLVVSDLQMPGGDGIELIKALPQGPPVLILTTFDTQALVYRAVDAGAAGYLLKDSPADTLLDGIRRAAAGQPVMSDAAATALMQRTRVAHSELSERETEIVRLLAAGRTNSDIAGELFISLATVKTHVSRIFDKLGVDNRTAAAKRARELGLIS